MAWLSGITSIFAMNVLMYVLAGRIQLYSDRYDYVDFRALLNNDTVRDAFYNCFMKIAPCTTPAQIEITGRFGESYQTNCIRCTEKQKQDMMLIHDWYVKNQPDKWELIVAKTEEKMKKMYIC